MSSQKRKTNLIFYTCLFPTRCFINFYYLTYWVFNDIISWLNHKSFYRKVFEIKNILYHLHELWKISLEKILVCAPLFVLQIDLWWLFPIFLTLEEAYIVEKQVFYCKMWCLRKPNSLFCKSYWMEKDFQINLFGVYLCLCMWSPLF